MNNLEKISQLRSLINDNLTHLIKTDFVYIDLPHYFNAGDTLIWEGTLDFIKSLPYKCRILASANKFYADKTIKWCRKNGSSATILLQGGGNFGDLWPMHQQFRNYIISNSPGVPIIVLPQTIYYRNEQNLIHDSKLYKGRSNLTICVRDYNSLEIARKYFPDNNPILVPDMAFCIDMEKRRIPSVKKDNLFVRRTDKEYSESVQYDIVPSNAIVSDWPTFNDEYQNKFAHTNSLNWAARIDCRLSTHLRDRLSNYYWNSEIRNAIVDYAIEFIGAYRNVYTTRMHAAILSVLLNREKIVLFDNSYGKSSSFADAWFNDLDNFKLCR